MGCCHHCHCYHDERTSDHNGNNQSNLDFCVLLLLVFANCHAEYEWDHVGINFTRLASLDCQIFPTRLTGYRIWLDVGGRKICWHPRLHVDYLLRSHTVLVWRVLSVRDWLDCRSTLDKDTSNTNNNSNYYNKHTENKAKN